VKARLIIDRPAASLRFYGWSEPTLSLGYFQPYSQRATHAASRACAVVRRQTGGGAILHDRELTYSLALPASHNLAKHAQTLYQAVHQEFIRALTSISDIATWQRHLQIRERELAQPSGEEPFLCFQRRSQGDVIWVAGEEMSGESGLSRLTAGPSKILGSAQRRYQGAVLQHGGLLLERSRAAPELAGLSDLGGLIVEFEKVIAKLRPRLRAALGLQLLQTALPPGLKSKAAELANNKYGSASWTNRR
jgi:lipoate-protein ligase A